MINNARRWAPRGAWRYGVALLALAVAFGTRMVLHPFLETHMPTLFFVLAAVAVGFSLGLGPAILIVVLSLPLADYFFVPPYRQLTTLDKSDFILVTGFPTVTLAFLAMIEWLRRTQYEARLIAEVAKSRLDMLLRAEKRRLKTEKSASISNRLLLNFSDDDGDVLYIGRVGSKYEYISEDLSQEFDAASGDTGTERLLAALYPDDARMLAIHLNSANDAYGRVLTMHLPRKKTHLVDLEIQVETFPTAHGDYIVMKKISEKTV
jgi:hypothetical protein